MQDCVINVLWALAKDYYVQTGTVICQRLSYQYVAVPALLLSSAKQLVIVTCVFQALVSTDATIAS